MAYRPTAGTELLLLNRESGLRLLWRGGELQSSEVDRRRDLDAGDPRGTPVVFEGPSTELAALPDGTVVIAETRWEGGDLRVGKILETVPPPPPSSLDERVEGAFAREDWARVIALTAPASVSAQAQALRVGALAQSGAEVDAVAAFATLLSMKAAAADSLLSAYQALSAPDAQVGRAFTNQIAALPVAERCELLGVVPLELWPVPLLSDALASRARVPVARLLSAADEGAQLAAELERRGEPAPMLGPLRERAEALRRALRAWPSRADPAELGDRERYRAEHLAKLPLPPTVRTFLTDEGLPHELPHLELRFRGGDDPLVKLTDEYESVLDDDVAEQAGEWRIIGSAIGGDPCCLDPSGRIVGLNHDAGFEPYDVASSPRQLVEVAALFVAMHAAARELYGEDDEIPDELYEAFRVAAEAVDPLAAGHFCRALA